MTVRGRRGRARRGGGGGAGRRAAGPLRAAERQRHRHRHRRADTRAGCSSRSSRRRSRAKAPASASRSSTASSKQSGGHITRGERAGPRRDVPDFPAGHRAAGRRRRRLSSREPPATCSGRGKLKRWVSHGGSASARLEHLGDFTVTTRVLPISGLAICIGVFAAYVALVLLKLIGLFTNLFFFQRVDTALVSPAGNHLGLFVILVPVARRAHRRASWRGTARSKIRGHGIPEAIEAILINGSRVEPKVALLKPLSSRHLDRLRRTVRRRRADHHDGRRVRLADRAVLPSDQRRAQDAARRGRRGRHVGDLRRAGRRRCCSPSSCCCSNGSRAASFRSRSPAPRPRPCAATSSGSGRSFPCRRIRRSSGLRASLGCVVVGLLGRRAVGAADAGGLRRRRTRSHGCRFTGCGGRPIGGLVIGIGGSSFRRRSASATTSSASCCRATCRVRVDPRHPAREVDRSGRSRSARARRAACSRRC